MQPQAVGADLQDGVAPAGLWVVEGHVTAGRPAEQVLARAQPVHAPAVGAGGGVQLELAPARAAAASAGDEECAVDQRQLTEQRLPRDDVIAHPNLCSVARPGGGEHLAGHHRPRCAARRGHLEVDGRARARGVDDGAAEGGHRRIVTDRRGCPLPSSTGGEAASPDRLDT